MSDEATDRMVVALADERATYIRAGRHDRIMMLDEQLAVRGWCVDNEGRLVRLKETMIKKAPENMADKVPEDAAEHTPENMADKVPDARVVREWAEGRGMDVPRKGRLPQWVIDAYLEADKG